MLYPFHRIKARAVNSVSLNFLPYSSPCSSLRRIMSIASEPHRDSYSSDNEIHFLGSFNSMTQTDSDIPGPGRLLGHVYSFFGRKLEDCLSVSAVKLGFGPHATALKIRRLAQEAGSRELFHEMRLEKARNRLVKYVR